MKRLLVFLIVAATVVSCVGAKGPPVESRFYTLEYAAPTPVAQGRRLNCILRVDAFDAPSFLATDRIVYREKPFRIGTYRYHRWEARPALLVARHLEQDLKSAGFCRAVLGSESLLPATHVLEGFVDRFYENDAQKGWEAVCSVSLTLAATRAKGAGVLMQRRYSSRRPCRHSTPQSLAEAMSRAMGEVSAQAVKDIETELAKTP